MSYKLFFSKSWALFCFIRFFIKVYCMKVTIEILLCHKYLENSPPKMSRDSKYLIHCPLVSANFYIICCTSFTFLYIESFLDLRNVPSSLLWIHLLWRYFIGSGTHQLESIIENNVIVAR